MPIAAPRLDFAAATARAKKTSMESLLFTIKDASEAAAIGKGWNQKEGYYLDEIHVCQIEIARRKATPQLCNCCGQKLR